jgi:DNA-binding MarR family transcriptional regulator
MSKNSSAEASRIAPLMNPLEEFLGYQLRRASQAMLEDLVTTLEDLDVRPTSASVLLLVGSNPGITQSRIGQILAIERANMVPMTAKLTRQGMLTRSRTDGRSHGLHLTDDGKRAAAKIRKRIADHEDKFWKDARASDRVAVLNFLKALWTQSPPRSVALKKCR